VTSASVRFMPWLGTRAGFADPPSGDPYVEIPREGSRSCVAAKSSRALRLPTLTTQRWRSAFRWPGAWGRYGGPLRHEDVGSA
jgi:hypothetical protein